MSEPTLVEPTSTVPQEASMPAKVNDDSPAVSVQVEDSQERIDELVGLRDVVTDLGKKVGAIADMTASLIEQQCERGEQARLREALLEKLEAARPGFQLQFIRPIVLRLGSIADLVADWMRQPPTETAGFAQCLRILQQQFRELLATHGVETLTPAEGQPFDCRFHYVVETRMTANEDQQDRIAATLQQGYVFFNTNERTAAIVPVVIRPARVITWKYDPVLSVPAMDVGESKTAEQAPPAS